MRARISLLALCLAACVNPGHPPPPDFSNVHVPPGGRLLALDRTLVVLGPDGTFAFHGSDGQRTGHGKVDGGLTTAAPRHHLFLLAGAQGVYYAAGGTSQKPFVRLDEPIEQMISGDFEPKRPGKELLLVTNEGGVHRLDTQGPKLVAELGDRVVGAEVFRAPDREVAMLATEGGGLCVLRQEDYIYRAHFFHYHDSDLVALSAGPWSKHGEPVFFAAGSDGVVLRISHGGPATWNIDEIHRAPETPKALVAGAFASDPKREAFALLGESGTIFLVERDDKGAWVLKRSESQGAIALARMGSANLLAVGKNGAVRSID